MAAQRSPHTPSSFPARTSTSKPSLLPTPRRPSFSTPAPGPSSPTGVSGFRALRSLLPFGPNKHSTSLSSNSAVSPPSSSRFTSFSAVRKSIQRDRNASFSVTDLPVLVIDQAAADASPELPLRKSISLHEKSTLFQPPLHEVAPALPTSNTFRRTQLRLQCLPKRRPRSLQSRGRRMISLLFLHRPFEHPRHSPSFRQLSRRIPRASPNTCHPHHLPPRPPLPAEPIHLSPPRKHRPWIFPPPISTRRSWMP
ncbi:hypothetical protein C8R46DRAFT_202513 [Mycena filopes]|nr:hypothetical protein C8R46DRAFT_202513 [Mycena filopes]